MFHKLIELTRNHIDSKVTVVDKDGNSITDENITELKKGELAEYIDELEADKVLQKQALNNLDSLEKSFSEDFYKDAEATILTKIQNIDNAIEKASGS